MVAGAKPGSVLELEGEGGMESSGRMSLKNGRLAQRERFATLIVELRARILLHTMIDQSQNVRRMPVGHIYTTGVANLYQCQNFT